MRTAQDIILKPIITEESMMGIMTKKRREFYGNTQSNDR